MYVEGVTKDADWASILSNSPAPWGEIATSKLVIASPRYSLQRVAKPSETASYWDKVGGTMMLPKWSLATCVRLIRFVTSVSWVCYVLSLAHHSNYSSKCETSLNPQGPLSCWSLADHFAMLLLQSKAATRRWLLAWLLLTADCWCVGC
jgi:hypothetical protein